MRNKDETTQRGGGGHGATEPAAVRSSAQDSMAEAELLVLHDDGHLAHDEVRKPSLAYTVCATSLVPTGQ